VAEPVGLVRQGDERHHAAEGRYRLPDEQQPEIPRPTKRPDVGAHRLPPRSTLDGPGFLGRRVVGHSETLTYRRLTDPSFG